VIADASLGTPLIGFGADGSAYRTPVVFVHGNDATPYPTGCAKAPTNMQAMAQYFADHGYATSELWAVGYQGTQCDLIDAPANSAGAAHTHAANAPDLIAFVRAVLSSTGARQVDIVAHGMGVTLAREAARLANMQKSVRRFVAIDGPNQGTLMCSASPQNYWQLGFSGGYTPASPLCQEIGSPQSPFLQTLNSKNSGQISADGTLVIRNVDTSFPYLPWNDGPLVAGVPAIDSFGVPTDFSGSPRIRGAREIILSGQQAYDLVMGSAHYGIANSPVTWQAAFSFLTSKR
jgi:pimeloyl-ACP methyl ester carboxylesterase